MDKGTIVGAFVAGGAILLGLMLEGGKVGQVLQPTAALIVFGGKYWRGTRAARMISG